MLPEQQQRILGYFIEEARDHLNTIEQGLLNLQGTLDDSEMINEVFRAAHSVKGGAAMLGLGSIQKASHRLEDCFKLLKENSNIQIDQKLESLFLSASDTLKALLEHLQGPFGLSEEKAAELISESEPTFKSLQEHLDSLIEQAEKNTSSSGAQSKGVGKEDSSAVANASVSSSKENLKQIQNQVLQVLREMLQLFKQQATSENREQLQQCTDKLAEIGKEENVTNWYNLCQSAKSAIANPDNTYLVLAKIVITEIKSALELLQAQKDSEIAVSEQLKALIPEIELLEISSSLDIFDTLESGNESHENITLSNVEQVASKDSEELIFDEEVTSVDEPEVSENISSLLDLDISGQFDPDQFYDDEDDLDLTGIDTGGPEVGVAELNTLADLFEGESPDLERSWTEENTVERSTPDKKQVESVEDISTDTEDELIKDFLSVEDNKSDQEQESEPSKDELTLVQLFGDFLDEEDFGSDSPSLGASDTKDNANINLFTDSKVTGNGELDVDVDVDSILGAPSDIDEDDNLDLEVDLEVDLNTTTDRDSLLIDEELSLSEVGNLEELQPDPIDKIPLDEFIGGNETNSLNNFQPDLLEDVSFADEVLPSVQTSSEDISNIFDVIEENQEKDIEQPTTSNLDSDLAEDRVIPQAVEEDFVQELEAGCSNLDNNIFSDISDRQINNENDSFDLADIDIDFDLEDKLDLDVLEDDTNDLFGDITSVPSDIFSSDRGKYKVSPQQMRGLSGSPEALESTPEFTNLNTEERTTKSLEENLKQINSKDLSSDVSLDNFESSSDETLQDLFADLPTVAFEEQENNTDNFLLESKDDIDDLFRSDSAVEDNIAIKNIPEASIPEVNIPEISTPEISSLEDISDSLSLETELEYNSGEQEAPIDDLFRLDSAVEDNIAIKNIPEASIPETSIPEVSIPEISSLEDISDSLNLETELEYNSGEQEAPIDDLFRLDSAVEDNIAIENIPEASIPEVNSLEDISDSLNLETELEYNSEEQEAPIDDLFRLDSAVEDNIAIENIPETSTPEASISEVSTPEASIPEISSLEDISDSLSLETELEYNSGEQEAPIDDLFRLDSSNQKIDAVAVDLLDTLTDIPNNNFEEIALPQSEEDDIFQNLEADTNISSKPKINIDTHIQTSEETVFQELETEFDIPEMQFDEEFSSELLDNSEEYDENLQISFDISEESISNSENFEKSNLEESVSDNSSNIGIEAAFLSNTFLKEETTPTEATSDLDFNTVENQFDELESLLNENETPALESELESKSDTPKDEDFAALEALLDEDLSLSQLGNTEDNNQEKLLADNEDEFSDLQKLLDEVDKSIPNSPSTQVNRRNSIRRAARERTMKVPVKHLDDMSNLVGELVVNRNTLEQDQERLRQFLDNLLHQIQQLSDVGARMQELYERSLLEASLLASKNNDAKSNRNTDRGFNELEMDRFTPFHTLSQEMIELIVRVRESSSDIEFVTEETERVARQFRQVTTQLQEGLTRSRMVPFAEATDRLKRGVRDNAIKCGKQVELVIEGQDTLIDKMILEHLTNPLTHMLNNAIAHGIETPEKRIAKGKSPGGAIHVCALYQGNQTVISVKDDGAGINSQKVKEKAINKGLLSKSKANNMSDRDVYELLFEPGFSTKDQADDLAGRGVGMDVVRTEISEIRGTVNIDSTIDKGTDFTIRLPVTLSICKALSCVSERAKIAFPMDGVEDTLDVPVKNIITDKDGKEFIAWRNTQLPFKPLKDLLTFNRLLSRGSVYGGTRDDDMVSVIVVRSANKMIALQVDQVLSEQEIVIKQFEGPAPKPFGVAGATVLGDGRIMAIADVLEIIDIFEGRTTKPNSVGLWEQNNNINDEIEESKVDPTVLIVDDSITVRELLSLTFSKTGYRVEQARDGQEAWDKLRSGLPCDIIFCDIEMPRCDGLELLSRIQDDENLNDIPIAMLTSRGADKHRQMAVELGASGYFTKPYLEEALLEAAGRMLKGEKLV